MRPSLIFPAGHFVNTTIIVLMMLVGLGLQSEVYSGQQLLNPPGQLPLKSKTAIDRMLRVQWSIESATDSPETFAQASKDSSTVLISYALNRFEFGDTKSALEITQEINQRFPTNLDGWMLTLWYQALTNKYDASLINIDKLHTAVEQQPFLAMEIKEAIYRRLGKLIGYFEGPVKPSVNEDLVLAAKAKLTKNLAPNLLTAFNESRDSVKRKFDELAKTHTDVEKVELSKAKVQVDEEVKRIKEANERLSETESRLTPQKDAIVAEANATISNIEQQASSVLAQFRNANASVYSIERDLAFVYAEWNNNHANDYHGNDYYLSTRIREAEYALSQARNSAFSLSNSLAALRNQLGRARRDYNGRVSQVNNEINNAKKTMRRNEGKLKRLGRGPSIADGKKSGRKNRRTSLRTYDDISLDLYRQQILDAIK